MSVSAHVTQIKEIAQNQGYPVMLESYNRAAKYYPQFCDVRVVPMEGGAPPAEYPDLPFGHKFRSVLGMENPEEMEHGQEFQAATWKGGYAPQFKIRKFGRSIRFTKETFDRRHAMDFVSGEIMANLAVWAPQFAVQEDTLVANIMQKGTLSAGHAPTFRNAYEGRNEVADGLIYDGKAFFATDHPQDDGAAGVSYSNLSVSAPLTEANWAASRLLLSDTNAKDGRGNRVIISPNTLLVGAAMRDTAERLLKTDRAVGTANNDVNLAFGSGYQLVVDPYLTDDATAWWAGERGKGITCIDSGEPEMDVIFDGLTQTVSVVVWKYFGVGVTNWRYWHANDKAAS